MHRAIFLGCGVADLPFQIKLLLPAHIPCAFDTMRRCINGGTCATSVRAALQVHGRHHVLAQLVGLLRRQHRRQLGNGGCALGQRRCTPCRLAGAGNHGKQGLAHIANLTVAQNRVIMNDGAAVVDTGNIGSGNDIHHLGHGTHRFQRQRRQAAMGHGRQAQSAVQRAFQLRQVVDIGSLTRHMQVGRFMLAAHAHACALALGRGFCALIDTVSQVLAVVGKGFGHQFIRQFAGIVHLRLLAPRRRG